MTRGLARGSGDLSSDLLCTVCTYSTLLAARAEHRGYVHVHIVSYIHTHSIGIYLPQCCAETLSFSSVCPVFPVFPSFLRAGKHSIRIHKIYTPPRPLTSAHSAAATLVQWYDDTVSSDLHSPSIPQPFPLHGPSNHRDIPDTRGQL